MRVVHRRTRLPAAAAALGLVGVFVVGWGPAARAAPPDSLAAFSAASSATPYGIVSRVPAETDGGFLFSKTTVQLGKATALAAGLTFGELGDVFIVTSAPKGTITTVPTVVNAQDPPSITAPREARFTGGQSGSDNSGQVRNFDVSARAADAPASIAQAAGSAISAPAFSAGASTSRSDSSVAPDGTVVTTGVTSVHNVVIGSGESALTIAAVDSIAAITIPPGGKPVPTLQVKLTGAQLAGLPVEIDSHGIGISRQVPVPLDALSQFRSALEQLAQQGLRFTFAPMSVDTTADGATVSGAAMTFGYHAPDAMPRPSDIGSDETFQLASVTAAATARQRAEPPGTAVANSPGAPAGPPAPAGAPPPSGFPALGPPPPGSAPAATPSVINVVAPAGDSTVPSTVFALPARIASPLPGEARHGYRFVLLAAVGGLAAIVVVRKRTG